MSNPHQLEECKKELFEVLFCRDAYKACEERLTIIQEYQEKYSLILESFRQDEGKIDFLFMRKAMLEAQHEADQLRDENRRITKQLNEVTHPGEKPQKEEQHILGQLEEPTIRESSLEETTIPDSSNPRLRRVQEPMMYMAEKYRPRRVPWDVRTQGVEKTLAEEIKQDMIDVGFRVINPTVRGYIIRKHKLYPEAATFIYRMPSGRFLAFNNKAPGDPNEVFHLYFRTDEPIDYYILVVYSKADDQLYIAVCPSEALYGFFPEHARCSPWNRKPEGRIMRKHMGLDKLPDCEYSFSLAVGGNSQEALLFRLLMQNFGTSEDGLNNLLGRFAG
jgi:hypothetical protein